MLMGSFQIWESKRSLPLTLLGTEGGKCCESVEEEWDLESFLLEVELRGTASRWACMRE